METGSKTQLALAQKSGKTPMKWGFFEKALSFSCFFFRDAFETFIKGSL